MKIYWPACPSCETDYTDLDAFDSYNVEWYDETCQHCAHTYQIRFTEDLAFETRPLKCERTLPLPFALPADHAEQEL